MDSCGEVSFLTGDKLLKKIPDNFPLNFVMFFSKVFAADDKCCIFAKYQADLEYVL